MRTHNAVGISMMAGLAMGAISVHTLRAQIRPPVYFIAENEVTNKEGYAKEYAPVARASIKAHGGRVIAAGKATALAGEPPRSRVVILAWDSMEQLQGWFNSPQYKKARSVGEKYATFRNYAVPAVAP